MISKTTVNIEQDTYSEQKIGNTTYRLTRVYSGKKDLNKTIQRLAVKKALDRIKTESNS